MPIHRGGRVGRGQLFKRYAAAARGDRFGGEGAPADCRPAGGKCKAPASRVMLWD
jgi:hypothetical protein